ncbi:hypothetical protein C8250_037280 [Streptomyces sp. So13.3]|uniref:hypothetical protein n=1 Tax=unclassified Streptomyces TaxID=2593676 RepID=UPI0011064ECF|nr:MULTISPECIES: hypothetical protein [unclassified Streptomyces]MCZ4097812.1 hypothetical protein [Streptomyces sp. H39-C1]QNA76778.1 hypothetical protein C8250_037280 [Streptomyces sp. So13.3]
MHEAPERNMRGRPGFHSIGYAFIELSYDSADRPILGGRYIIDVAAQDAAPQTDAFWVGRWQMDHDGWRGTLDITSAVPFAVSYTAADGQGLAVDGGPDPGLPHVLRISIPFSPDNIQQFQLFAHTWEKDVFSGLTQWGPCNFGVQGNRG